MDRQKRVQMGYLFTLENRGFMAGYWDETDEIEICLAVAQTCFDSLDDLIDWLIKVVSHEHMHRVLSFEENKETSESLDDLCMELEERDLQHEWMRDYLGGSKWGHV